MNVVEELFQVPVKLIKFALSLEPTEPPVIFIQPNLSILKIELLPTCKSTISDFAEDTVLVILINKAP